MTKTRISPEEFVGHIGTPAVAPGGWLEALSQNDREYIHAVVEVLKTRPNVSCVAVAKKLIDTLKIKRCVMTVTRTLRELRNEA